jgi:RimJ/RimL family protein N-acetyltransferase
MHAGGEAASARGRSRSARSDNEGPVSMRLPNPLPTLATERLVLRRPEPRDVADRLAYGRDPEIYRMFGADISALPPFTAQNAEAWVDGVARHPAAWIISLEGRAIGEVLLDNAVDADMRVGLSIGILDPSALGKGYGPEAMRAVCAFAFEQLGLHRISIRVLAANTRAIRSYEKIGFQREGLERQSARVGQRYEDDVLMGLLAGEMR